MTTAGVKSHCLTMSFAKSAVAGTSRTMRIQSILPLTDLKTALADNQPRAVRTLGRRSKLVYFDTSALSLYKRTDQIHCWYHG